MTAKRRDSSAKTPTHTRGEFDPPWRWDETLYAGSAPYYERGRLPYAPGLADLLAEILMLDGRGRLIDVGCGPGILALSLVHLFDEVVGVDPDGEMIAQAERRAAEVGATGKTRWIRARAEELPEGLGTFAAATFGQSFHWMERDRVAATINGMLAADGAFVHISDLKGESLDLEDLSYPPAPYTAIKNLIRQYLGPVRRAGQGVLPQGTPGNEAAVLTRAGFDGPERYVVQGGHALERSVDDVLAWIFSRSDSAPHLFGHRRGSFEQDVTRLLRKISPSGRFTERQPSTEVNVWRKAPRAYCGVPSA